jgi:hypothetical protein
MKRLDEAGSLCTRRWQADLEEAWGDDIRVEAEAYFGGYALVFDVPADVSHR